MNSNWFVRTHFKIILSPFLVFLLYSFAMSDTQWVPFSDRVQTPSALNYKQLHLQRTTTRTTFSLAIEFPGALVFYPDDFGLLAGNYAQLQFMQKEVELLNLNCNGTFQPEKQGYPDLPFVRFHVQIPSSVTPEQVQVGVTDPVFTTLTGEYLIAPIQEQLPESFTCGVDTDFRVFKQEQKIYSQDSYFNYPLEYDVASLHGMKIVEIRYCPIEYNPVQKKLRVMQQATFSISYPGSAIDQSTSDIFESIVYNSTIDGIHAQIRTNGIEQQPQIRGGKVVIVSAAKLLNTKTLEDWISYRTAQGYTFVEKIDIAKESNVKSKLQTLYKESKFDYVVIVGDETVVPIPVEGSKYHYKDWSRLDGTDNLEDVGFGIFLADTEEKLQNIVQHQKWQEAGGPWGTTQLSTSGAEIKSGTWDRFSTGHFGTVHLDNPTSGLGYKVKRVYQVASVPTKYGGSNIGLPTVAFEPWTLTPTPFFTNGTDAVNQLVNFWNEGIVNISHRDHGAIAGTGTPSIKGTLFSTGKISSTSSPYFTSLNCLTGNFKANHGTNLAYLAQSSKYGTCTNVGATVVTYSGDNDNLHIAMYLAMYPKKSRSKINNVGKIWLQGHIKGQTHSRTFFHNWGDPLTNLNFGGATDLKSADLEYTQSFQVKRNNKALSFVLPTNIQVVTLKFYSLQGQMIKSLSIDRIPYGIYSVNYSELNLASGMYVAQIQTSDFSKTISLLIK